MAKRATSCPGQLAFEFERRCGSCHQVLPLEQFNRSRSHRNGRTSRCRSCSKAYNRRYHLEHREQNLTRSVRWHEANPERSAAIKRRYYEANRAAAIARTTAWKKAHPVEKAERQRRDRARKLATTIARITPDLLAGKLAYWGWRCWLCGAEPTGWDHVKPSTKGGPHILANLRPACQPCNTRKLNRWPFPTHRRH
jgi:5-methylcytosine-specific restriction endonuclease McrA